MKINKYVYAFLLGSVLMTTGCSDFTDIQPKGKNLLSTTDELEMLLNTEFTMKDTDLPMLCGDLITTMQHIPTLLGSPTKTRAGIIISWDEDSMDKMAELTQSDNAYSNYYGIIGRIANAILSHVDEASGDESVKRQLRCEALVMRAYFHYLLVNKFAKAYNPSTAAQDPGIPYMTEEADITQPVGKLTVQEVYNRILEDVDEAIILDGLPTKAVNRMRMCKPCAYACKALALISMQQFDEAEEAAEQALASNDAVSDYNQMLTTFTGYITGGEYPVLLRTRMQCEEDLFYDFAQESRSGFSPEAWNAFEDGHACRDKMATDYLMYDKTMTIANTYLGLSGYVLTYDINSGWNSIGMKTTHMYLIVAEAEIHKGNYDAAMEALDEIRVNRIDPDVYVPLKGTVDTETEAIEHLKQTSHGENIYSCYNFINRKRWNQVEGYKATLTRNLNGTVYTLEPESKIWIFPFPLSAVSLNPNLTQNYNE